MSIFITEKNVSNKNDRTHSERANVNMKRKVTILMALVLIISIFTPSFDVKGEGMDVTAPSAVLMEYSSGQILFEKNSHEQRSCASITKVMTLILTFEAIEEGKLTLDEQLTASAHAESMGGSDIWLKEGEVMSVDDLLKATVIMSANDAAVVLAEKVSGSEDAFVQKMNEKAAQLGMLDTVFKNCNGLDEEGHVTSAHDVALMSRELMKYPKVFEYTGTWIDSLRNGETQLVNTNKLIRSYKGITGLKTGTTGQAKSCISATAERDNMSLIAVVLGAENTNDRFKDAAALLDYGFANWSITIPELPFIDAVEITRGMADEISVEIADSAPPLLMQGVSEENIETEIVLLPELTAPIEIGQIVGKIEYSVNGEKIAEIDVKSTEKVEGITFSSSFFYLLRSFISI